MKRILIFSTAYLPHLGGAEVAIKEITDRIDGAEFDMITLQFDKKLPLQEKIGNVNVYRIKGRNKYLYVWRAWRLGIKLYKEKGYNMAWSMMAAYAGFACTLFNYSTKVPYVLSLQEGDPIPHIKRRALPLYPLFKRIFREAKIVQAISNYLADFAKDMGSKGEVKVIPNGVDIERFEKFENKKLHEIITKHDILPSDIVISSVSRLVHKNAVDVIIKSLTHLPDNIKFINVSGGPLRAQLESLVNELGLKHRVVLIGNTPNDQVPNYLHVSNIFVRPSRSEGQGISFLEAMAAGIPVIATEVGGIPDFLEDGKTGLMCKVDDPKDLAEKIKTLAEDILLRQELALNAKKLVRENYDWDDLAKQMKEEVFEL